MVELVIFYLFSAVLIVASVAVVTVRNPIHSVLLLVLAFFTSAALWMLMEAEFLAITLVLVYVGAVMVLFLFVIMMLDINVAPLREGFVKYLPLGIGVALLVAFELIAVVGSKRIADTGETVRHAADYSNTQALGSVLYTEYVYPFEIASVILLVAIIAAISLTMRRRTGLKSRPPSEQVAVRPADEVRIVKMAAESDRRQN